MSGKIAITPRSLSGSGHPALSQLTERGYELVFPSPGKTPSIEDLSSTIPACVGWLAGVEPIPGSLLQEARDLRVISRNGTGVDNIEMPVADKLGIEVTRTVGANARGVSELAFALMLSAFRQVPWSDAMLRAGRWERRIGIEAEGRSLGVVGCGAIGREVAKMGLSFGMTVKGYDPFPTNTFSPDGFVFAALEDVLSQSDAISLHCPPTERPLIDADVLSQARPGVVIVNTARAELVDEDAMLDALNSGQVSAYATDVYRKEPPDPSPLLEHDRVILMPHAGGFTRESVDRATEGAVENLLNALENG